MKNDLDLKALPQLLETSLRKSARYVVIMFVVLIAAVYGFMLYQINSLSNMQPSPSATTQAASSSSIPRIDPSVVQRLETLKDNSVNVQAIFNDSRDNPFHE